MVKPSKKAFMITLIALVVILIGYGLVRMAWGPLLPETIDKNLPDALIVIAVGIMLWNRKIATEEKRAAEAAKEAEKLAASQGAASSEAAPDPAGGEANSDAGQ
jgi:hypothetical protein